MHNKHTMRYALQVYLHTYVHMYTHILPTGSDRRFLVMHNRLHSRQKFVTFHLLLSCLHVYVSMSVSMYISWVAYVCMYPCVWVCVYRHVWMNVCPLSIHGFHALLHTCSNARVCVCVCVCVPPIDLYFMYTCLSELHYVFTITSLGMCIWFSHITCTDTYNNSTSKHTYSKTPHVFTHTYTWTLASQFKCRCLVFCAAHLHP